MDALNETLTYCISRFQTHRRSTRVVNIGSVGIGGEHPIRIQSMTTTPPEDSEATVRQIIALVDAGCEIVRLTIPNKRAVQSLKEIRDRLEKTNTSVPLVADIHFQPSVALAAAEYVEKVRINPGNYADRKTFKQREYTDAQYQSELNRLYDAFSPLVLRLKALGRSLRIGTNHGSLSDRILNRYGDTPLGMVESTLEFVRICESHGFYDIILSMKASNPKVMIQAYRLAVAGMNQEKMAYPLHLGVTEAGEGEDARIKSAIGIGALLYDGLGDSIRVSLTEDPVAEIPVAYALAGRASELWEANLSVTPRAKDAIDPFTFNRRFIDKMILGASCPLGSDMPPRVIEPISQARLTLSASDHYPIEGLLVKIAHSAELKPLKVRCAFAVLDLADAIEPQELLPLLLSTDTPLVLCRRFGPYDTAAFERWYAIIQPYDHVFLALNTTAAALSGPLQPCLTARPRLIFTQTRPQTGYHALGSYRALAQRLDGGGSRAPIWIRNTAANVIASDATRLDSLIEASMLTGSLLCDGIGDLVSIETEVDCEQAVALTYNLLQGARTRMDKTEYVACPSCGRTLFDLQLTTQRIKAKTQHLKGVTIAVMGCIVNGPGEMADADFGYVGGAPGKINLYVGKKMVQAHIPESEAVDRLIALIRQHGKWVDP